MVFGPAYLDRVLRVEEPLHDPASTTPLDQSVEGRWKFTEGSKLELRDRAGFALQIELPDEWPGPFGQIELGDPFRFSSSVPDQVHGVSWHDDLGGKGAGFAAALGGTLTCALGTEDDRISRKVEEFLRREGIDYRPVRISCQPADSTLLLSSGKHGDKLAIGFRGCHKELDPTSLDTGDDHACDLRVAAALPNTLAGLVLARPGAYCRLFAPAMRNMIDQECRISGFAGSIDVLCCNRHEWETLADREEVARRVSILVVTDGAEGCLARFTEPGGYPGTIRLPAFPRDRPPADTNRAGETFAACLVATLLVGGWEPALAVVEPGLIRLAMQRASAAAALTLDRTAFGFPREEQIDAALAAGRVY
jgi:ribokinase